MKFFIYVNNTKTKAQDIYIKLKKILDNKNITIVDSLNDADIALSIGGDGTFIELARKLQNNNIPIAGINGGTLGYLTDINIDNMDEMINNITNHNYYIEERMMICGQIKHNNKIITQDFALNDICLAKNGLGIIRFDLYVNNTLLNQYTADGLITCTPTGSTAYNLSCGGPILEPTANSIIITPIAPHTIMNRSIVLSNQSKIQIKINEIRNNDNCFVIFDGNVYKLSEKDEIEIELSKHKTNFLKFKPISFLDTIREKMI